MFRITVGVACTIISFHANCKEHQDLNLQPFIGNEGNHNLCKQFSKGTKNNYMYEPTNQPTDQTK